MSLDEMRADGTDGLVIDDDGPSGEKLRSFLGIGVIAVALSALIILSATSLVMEDEPIDIGMKLSLEDEGSWRHDDVDPAFAWDGGRFSIEPAAGSSDPSELDICHEPAIQQIACSHNVADD